MRLRFTIWAAACVGLLCCAACEPPGKPGAGSGEAATVTDFKTLFAQNCAGCHGENGRMGPGRILNDPIYLALVPQDALRDVIENGRPGTAMPAWADKQGGPLRPNQIAALVDGIKRNWAKPVSGAPLPGYANAKTGGNPDTGKKLFSKACFGCHGPGSRIGAVTDPSYLALTTNQNLRTSIIVGRPDLGMPDYRVLNAGHPLNDQNVADLVAYLASKRPAGSVAAKEEEMRGEK
jgi:mono/diheme cytochrome c family protein